MTAYVQRLALAAGWIETPGFRAGATLLRQLGAGLQHIQYAQMVSVLNQLPESCLKDASLRRRDIPEQARKAIYGDD